MNHQKQMKFDKVIAVTICLIFVGEKDGEEAKIILKYNLMLFNSAWRLRRKTSQMAIFLLRRGMIGTRPPSSVLSSSILSVDKFNRNKISLFTHSFPANRYKYMCKRIHEQY